MAVLVVPNRSAPSRLVPARSGRSWLSRAFSDLPAYQAPSPRLIGSPLKDLMELLAQRCRTLQDQSIGRARAALKRPNSPQTHARAPSDRCSRKCSAGKIQDKLFRVAHCEDHVAVIALPKAQSDRTPTTKHDLDCFKV